MQRAPGTDRSGLRLVDNDEGRGAVHQDVSMARLSHSVKRYRRLGDNHKYGGDSGFSGGKVG